MTPKKKFTLITIISLVSVLVIGAVVTVLIWALKKPSIDSELDVTYTADSVNATVWARCLIEGEEPIIFKTEDEKDKIVLTESGISEGKFESPGNIDFRGKKSIYLEYKFQNDYNSKDILVNLAQDAETKENMAVSYGYSYEQMDLTGVSNLSFSDNFTEQVILGKQDVASDDENLNNDNILYIYVKISPIDTEYEAKYKGTVKWELEAGEGVKLDYMNIKDVDGYTAGNYYSLLRYYKKGKVLSYFEKPTVPFKLFKGWKASETASEYVNTLTMDTDKTIYADLLSSQVNSSHLTKIGDSYTLSGSYQLTGTLVIPDCGNGGYPITKIAESVFVAPYIEEEDPSTHEMINTYKVNAVITDVIMSDNVVEMGSFARQLNLETIKLSSNLKAIPASAFRNCKNLTEVVVPASVRSVGGYAFSNEGGMGDSVLDKNGNTVNSQKLNVTFEDNSKLTLMSEDSFYGANLGDVDFGKNSALKEIGAYSFRTARINSIKISGNSELKIGSGAFINAILGEFVVPKAIVEIGNNAFQGANVNIEQLERKGYLVFEEGSKLNRIGDGAFNSSSLELVATIEGTKTKVIKLPASVRYIGKDAFRNCVGLERVIFEDNKDFQIGESAFEGCNNLKVVEFISGETQSLDNEEFECKIGESAFSGLVNLTKVDLGENSNLKTIEKNAFYGCTGLSAFEIPASVTSIGEFIFNGCSGLQSITFEEGTNIQALGACAFYNCGITSFVVPVSVKVLGAYAFGECANLVSLTFMEGNELTEVRGNVINGCDSLTTFVVPNTVTKIFSNAFENASNTTIKIYSTCKANLVVLELKDIDSDGKDDEYILNEEEKEDWFNNLSYTELS